jgi:hypothetical protein
MQKYTLPYEMAKSVSERSKIRCAVDNLHNSTNYIKTWIKHVKSEPTQDNIACLDYAIQLSINIKNEFLANEHLANLYSEIWREEYYKKKHFYEKAVTEGETILKAN